ncbi:MAG: helix-turn-helix domain-containing protein [Firmicutes bacterium]|nr:helix-turn-helix domain-containing protein [Bacillota bacterium]
MTPPVYNPIYLSKAAESIGNMLHDADIQKAYKVLDMHFENANSKLKSVRKRGGTTQEELSQLSGVSLNTIRAYERKGKDINKARVQYR